MATPMLIAQLLNLLYNIVDRIYIGKIPGEGTLALASIGLCFPFVTLITAFANLFGLGGAPLCAMARGKGNREGAQGIMVNAGFMLLLSGAVLTVLGIACRPRWSHCRARSCTMPLSWMRRPSMRCALCAKAVI